MDEHLFVGGVEGVGVVYISEKFVVLKIIFWLHWIMEILCLYKNILYKWIVSSKC